MSRDEKQSSAEMKIKRLEAKVAALKTMAEKYHFSEQLAHTLFDISDAVLSTEHLEDLYSHIYHSLNKLLNLPNFYIALYQEKNGTLKIPFFIDQFDAEVYYEKTFDVNASLTGEVILSREPVFLTEEMLIERKKQNKILGTAPKIWLGVPLTARKKVIGIMAIQSYDDPHYFGKTEQDILVSVSNQVALAIDRKQSLDEIRLLQNYLFNIINSMPSILVGVNKDRQVTQWNIQAQIETGIHMEEAMGKDIRDVFPRLTEKLDQITDSMVLRKVKTSLKNRFTRDGEVRYEDIIIYPLITNGVDGAVIRMDDVTDQVRLEEMMIQSEKMLSIGGLAAGMAHEINNPLAGMMQNAQVVYQRLYKDLPANVQTAEALGLDMEKIRQFMEQRGIFEKLETINQTGGRAARIISNMLGFARKSDVDNKAWDMAAILMDTLELAKSDYDLKNQYDFKKISIKTDFDPDIPEVWCNKSKIQQVFLNLFKNGAQAMHDQPKPHDPPRFILRLKKESEMVRIEIEDNGPGMDDTIRNHLFEPFFTTKEVGKGTGLGLSVSYFIIVNDHKGSMRVQSTPGKSTTFIIRLPLKTRLDPETSDQEEPCSL